MGLVLLTPPASQAVTTQQAKEHIRVTHANDDAYIDGLIIAATDYVEFLTGRRMITQTWRLLRRQFDSKIYLGTPLESVNQIRYLDPEGIIQSLAATQYRLITSESPGYIEPVYGVSWPSVRIADEAVEIDFTVGYGVSNSTLPKLLQQAILFLVGHFYENREASAPIKLDDIPLGFFAMLEPYRVHAGFA